jgi:NADP-dependent 3-hydroxy acid dehydrogenase YdfG
MNPTTAKQLAVITGASSVAGPDGVEELFDTIQSMGRPVDAIAINAGVGVSGDFASETDLEAELNLINLNVTSSVHITKLVLQDMVARGQGRIRDHSHARSYRDEFLPSRRHQSWRRKEG